MDKKEEGGTGDQSPFLGKLFTIFGNLHKRTNVKRGRLTKTRKWRRLLVDDWMERFSINFPFSIGSNKISLSSLNLNLYFCINTRDNYLF